MADIDLDKLEDSFFASLSAMRTRKLEIETELPKIDMAIGVLQEQINDIRRQKNGAR